MPTEDGRPGVIAAGAEFEPVKYDPRCGAGPSAEHKAGLKRSTVQLITTAQSQQNATGAPKTK